MEDHYEETGEMPQALKDEVKLDAKEKEYAARFFDLSSQRTVSNHIVSQIPYGEIKAYAELYDIYEMDVFLRHIRAMDKVYVECVSNKIKQELERLKRQGNKR